MPIFQNDNRPLIIALYQEGKGNCTQKNSPYVIVVSSGTPKVFTMTAGIAGARIARP
jgi:hypothetical protein